MQRVKVRYEGRVQGVGFRATVRGIADGFPVTGQVRNMSDGSVEMIAEGQREDLDPFRAAIRQYMGNYIVQENESWEEIDEPKYQRFEIASTEF